MSRPLLIASVALASYAALNLAISLIVAAVWRRLAADHAGVSPAARARQLVWVRACPGVGAAAITLTVITPAFAIFEPERASEMAGPVVIMLAVTALVQLGASLVMAAATLARTRAAAQRMVAVGHAARRRSTGGSAGLRHRIAGANRRAGRRLHTEADRRSHRDRILHHGRIDRHRRARARPSPCPRQPQALADGVRPGRAALDAIAPGDRGRMARRR